MNARLFSPCRRHLGGSLSLSSVAYIRESAGLTSSVKSRAALLGRPSASEKEGRAGMSESELESAKRSGGGSATSGDSVRQRDEATVAPTMRHCCQLIPLQITPSSLFLIFLPSSPLARAVSLALQRLLTLARRFSVSLFLLSLSLSPSLPFLFFFILCVAVFHARCIHDVVVPTSCARLHPA